MRAARQISRTLAVAACALCVHPGVSVAQRAPGKSVHIPKTVWNFEGGVFMETDGSVSENTCFRLAGRVAAIGFFDNLKRVDDDHGTRFLRGKEPVTTFPEQVKLLFVIRDSPCPIHWRDSSHRELLTREMMSKLHLSLYWKRGVELRPIEGFKIDYFSVNPIPPYARELADKLPEKLQWSYELDIPTAGIPLTDSLVLIFRGEDGSIAARVSARL